ncbi:MAG TPA: hypothetical protein VKQ73_09455 [Stellaceae bacterium]|nr:hypothetical protein [Stellaceae bacterium]
MKISDWINSILAVATVLMAGGTFYLAYVTRKLAEEAAEATRQAERHHQENQHDAQERERTAKHQLWESIAALARSCLDAIDALLKNYPQSPGSDAWGSFLRSHAQSDFDVPTDGLAAVPLHQVGNSDLVTAVLRLRGDMGHITRHLDDVRASKGVMPLSPDIVRTRRTPVFNAVASVLRIVEGPTASDDVSRLAFRQ